MKSSQLKALASRRSVKAKPQKIAAPITYRDSFPLAISGAIALVEAHPSKERPTPPSLVVSKELDRTAIDAICSSYLHHGGYSMLTQDWQSASPVGLFSLSSSMTTCRELYRAFRHRCLKYSPIMAKNGSERELLRTHAHNLLVDATTMDAREIRTVCNTYLGTERYQGNLLIALPNDFATPLTIANLLCYYDAIRSGWRQWQILRFRRDDQQAAVLLVTSHQGGRGGQTFDILLERVSYYSAAVEKAVPASDLAGCRMSKVGYITPNVDFLYPQVDLAKEVVLGVSQSGMVRETGLYRAVIGAMAEIPAYDSIAMREAPLGSQLASRPSVLARGIERTRTDLAQLGFTLECSPETEKRIAKLSRQAELDTTPLMTPCGSQLLAYYNAGFRVAEANGSVKINGRKRTLFKKGHRYLILPSFEQQCIECTPAVVESMKGGKKRRLLEQTSIVSNYATFLVESELGDEERKIVGASVAPGADHSIKTGLEAAIEKQVSALQARLRMATRVNTVARLSAQISRLREDSGATHSRLLEVSERSPDLLGAFLTAFPAPNVQTVADRYPEKVRMYADRAIAAVPSLTRQQLHDTAVAATKNGVIVTHAPSAGKTRISIAITCARKASRVLYVSKSKNIAEAEAELKSLGLPYARLRTHRDIDALKERVRAGTRSALPEFYLATQEFLALGWISNQIFDSWPAYFKAKTSSDDRDFTEHVVWSRRHHCKADVEAYLDQHGLTLAKQIPYNFGNHVTWCPKCLTKLLKDNNVKTPWHEALQDDTMVKWINGASERAARMGETFGNARNGLWTPWGTCRACGHSARTYVVHNDGVSGEEVVEEAPTSSDVTELESILLGSAAATAEKPSERESYKQYPAYKRLKGLFTGKILDEFHNLSSESLQSIAASSIGTELTIVLSGTLTKKSPEELWRVFTATYGYNNPRFPYRYSERNEFAAMHVTKSTVVQRELPAGFRNMQAARLQAAAGKVVKRTNTMIPEPSNVQRLWKTLKMGQIHRTEAEVDADLSIPPAVPQYHECRMDDAVREVYDKAEAGLLAEAAILAGEQRVDASFRENGWFAKMNALCAIGFETKLPACIENIRADVADGRKAVVAVKGIKTFQRAVAALKASGIPFVALDTASCKADERRDYITNHFANGEAKVLLSRTLLINEAINNLTCASSIHVLENEYVFHPIKQLERRLTRPTQKAKNVLVNLYVARKDEGLAIDQAMLLVSTRRKEANTQLIDGSSSFRSSEELVRLATQQRQEQFQVLIELVKNNHKTAGATDYLDAAIRLQVASEVGSVTKEAAIEEQTGEAIIAVETAEQVDLIDPSMVPTREINRVRRTRGKGRKKLGVQVEFFFAADFGAAA